MKKLIKQVVGIDVAQNELVVSLGKMYDDWTPEHCAAKTVPNTKKGFDTLLSWVEKLTDQAIPVRYVMEATGVYHEAFAYHLKDQNRQVSIVLPNKISNYFRTLSIKTVTDKTASEAIARFGLERNLDEWQKPSPLYKNLRQLTRERDQLVIDRTVAKNQLHAEEVEALPNPKSIARVKQRIKLLDTQVKEIMTDIASALKAQEEVQQTVKLLCSVTGIGLLTAVTVLAETNGFDLIRNKRQLVSYAGLDVVEKQSGTSIKGKTKISKKGNRYLRKALYMPAMSAIRHDERFKGLYARLISRHGIPKKAQVPVQRKLLELMYTLVKKGESYDMKHFENKQKQTEAALSTTSAQADT